MVTIVTCACGSQHLNCTHHCACTMGYTDYHSTKLTYWDSYGSLNASYKDDKRNEKGYGQVQVDVQQCSLVERLPV